jgi:hypothetical protein
VTQVFASASALASLVPESPETLASVDRNEPLCCEFEQAAKAASTTRMAERIASLWNKARSEAR